MGAENVTSFRTVDDVVIIGARLAEGSAARDSFQTVAGKFRDVYSFALTSPGVGLDGKVYTEQEGTDAQQTTTAAASQDLVSDDGGGGKKKRKPGRGVACYHNRDATTFMAEDTDLLSPSTLERFVRRCAEPLVPELSRRNEDELLKQAKSLVYFFHWSAALRATWRRAALPLAKRYEEYLSFCTTDSYEFQELYAQLGMGADVGLAGLTVQNPGLGQVYPYRGEGMKGWMQEMWDTGANEADTEPPDAPELIRKMRELVEGFVTDIVEGRVEAIKAKGSKFTGRRVVEDDDRKDQNLEDKHDEQKQEPTPAAEAQPEATVQGTTQETIVVPVAEPKHDEL